MSGKFVRTQTSHTKKQFYCKTVPVGTIKDATLTSIENKGFLRLQILPF